MADEKKSLLSKIVFNFAKKDIEKIVKEELDNAKNKWAKEQAEELINKKYSLGRISDYTSTSTKKNFKAAETSSNKQWELLYNIYSEAPGSPQSADRIRSAVTGAGYILQPVPGKDKNEENLKTLIEFFDNPNPEATIEGLVQSIVTNYYAVGNSYIEKVYDSPRDDDNKKLAEIYTLPSADMTILVDVEKRKAGVNIPLGYELKVPFAQGTTPEKRKIIYEMDEIVHFRRPDPKGGLYGQPLFEDNQSVMQLILQALIYNIKTFENSGKPPLKIRLPEGTSMTEALEYSHFFEKNFQGTQNAGKALILYNNANAEALGLTPQDMEYLKLLGFGLKQVTGMYGVPMIMISQPEGSNRATSYEETKSFYQRVVKPLRKYVSDKITKEIIVEEFGIDDWRLDFQDIDLEDSSKRVEEASKSFMYGTRNWNEARKRMGLTPGTEPWMDEFYVVHNGIATPLKDFGTGKAKTQTDRMKDKDTKKSAEVEKVETKSEAEDSAKKENELMNKGEIIDPERSQLHKIHIEQHKKVFFTMKDKYKASLRLHVYAHEDMLREQDDTGSYGRISGEKKPKK